MDASPFGRIVYDHYVRFLGEPTGRDVFRIHEGSIQVFTFPDVFPECLTFATLGFGAFSHRMGRGFHEVVMAVDAEPSEVPTLLVKVLLAAAENDLPIEPGTSLAGIGSLAPSFVQRTHKEALLFMEPFAFPAPFAEPREGELHAHIHLAVPISRAEHALMKSQGYAALEAVFAKQHVDPFDVLRSSAV